MDKKIEKLIKALKVIKHRVYTEEQDLKLARELIRLSELEDNVIDNEDLIQDQEHAEHVFRRLKEDPEFKKKVLKKDTFEDLMEEYF